MGNWIDTTLNVAKFVPVVGTAASGISMVRNVMKGNYGLAVLDAVGLVPFGAQVTKMGTWAAKAGQAASKGAAAKTAGMASKMAASPAATQAGTKLAGAAGRPGEALFKAMVKNPKLGDAALKVGVTPTRIVDANLKLAGKVGTAPIHAQNALVSGMKHVPTGGFAKVGEKVQHLTRADGLMVKSMERVAKGVNVRGHQLSIGTKMGWLARGASVMAAGSQPSTQQAGMYGPGYQTPPGGVPTPNGVRPVGTTPTGGKIF